MSVPNDDPVARRVREAAARAQAEAEARRRAEAANPLPAERGGPRGPEPTRYGDWERGGRAVDF